MVDFKKLNEQRQKNKDKNKMNNFWAQNNFNANDEQHNSDGFTAIEPGEYVAIITDTEWKEPNGGGLPMLQATLQIVEGDCKGRMLFDYLCVNHVQDNVKSMAMKKMASICRAINTPTPQDDSELHDKPLVIKVGYQKKKDPADDLRNNVKKYAPLGNGGTSPAPATKAQKTSVLPSSVATPTNLTSAGGKKAWEK